MAILATARGSLWALLLVLFFPGYVTVAALFPSEGLGSRLRQLVGEFKELRAAAQARGADLKPYKNLLTQANDAAEGGRLLEAIQLLEGGNDHLRQLVEGGPAGASKRAKDVPPAPARNDADGGDIDWVERISLSFALSIGLVSLLGLVLNFTPWGIRLESIVAILFLFTVLVGIVAYGRRMRLHVEDRLSATIRISSPLWLEYSAVDKVLAGVFAASIVFAVAVLAYVAVTPRPTERFTQFYLLDRNGTVDPGLYPTRLNVSEPGTVIITVVNNESVRVDYTVIIDLVGVQIVRNATTGLNDTIELNRSTIGSYSVSLDDHGVWQQPYVFAINSPGTWRVDFLLYRSGLPAPYRHVYLPVEVVAVP